MSSALLIRLATAASIVVATAAIGLATIPDAQGVIHGCYARSGGTVRIIDNGVTACKQGETALSWGVQGPPGPQGIPGPQGATGEPGPKGDPGDTRVLTISVVDGLDRVLNVPNLGTINVFCTVSADIRIESPADFYIATATDNGRRGFWHTRSFIFGAIAFRHTGIIANTLGRWQFDMITVDAAATGGEPGGGLRVPCTASVVITRLD